MKKLILLCIFFILTGCTNINTSSINTLVNEAVSSRAITTNVNRNGYRYYLPKTLNIKNSRDFNETITNHKYMIYLYVDVVSYNNKTDFSYNINKSAYYSNSLNYNGIKGFIEINKYKNDKYLIEIMYNYAKIEVVVYEKDIKNVLANAMTIISSITYNDNVIVNYLASSSFEGSEESFNIFEIVGRKSYLQITDEETKKEDENKDPDYIN